jgi:peptide/nickel transport system substrate-binding protein
VPVGLGVPSAAVAQKQGGILKVYHRDSPASMSILEEATISSALPMMESSTIWSSTTRT